MTTSSENDAAIERLADIVEDHAEQAEQADQRMADALSNGDLSGAADALADRITMTGHLRDAVAEVRGANTSVEAATVTLPSERGG